MWTKFRHNFEFFLRSVTAATQNIAGQKGELQSFQQGCDTLVHSPTHGPICENIGYVYTDSQNFGTDFLMLLLQIFTKMQ